MMWLSLVVASSGNVFGYFVYNMRLIINTTENFISRCIRSSVKISSSIFNQ